MGIRGLLVAGFFLGFLGMGHPAGRPVRADEPQGAGPRGAVVAKVQSEKGEQGMRAELTPVVEGDNQFAADLYGRLKGKTSGNLFFSPYSISTALAMTYAGAAGETQKQMAQTLHFSVPEPELHPVMAQLRKALVADAGKGIQFRLANRLWGQEGYKFLPEFLRVTRQDYGAELGIADFAHHAEKVRQEINAWVAKETEDKIKDLIPAGVLTPLTRLVLTNAVYFKGTWESQFDKKATKDAPFHLAAGSDVTVPMMHQTREFGYRALDDLQVLEMPYTGGALSMVVFLPKAADGLADLEKKLTPKSIQEWSTGLARQKIIVFVPRFKTTSQFALKDVLESMGMTLAFDPRKADFSRMSRIEGTDLGDLYISAVLHKAFVDVNEEGTEAAAATGVIMSTRAARPRPEQPPVFRADHPFAFLIRDNRTGSIVFMGRVMNPKE